MPVVTRVELENAQRDVTDLGKVVNGAANLANPAAAAPNNVGTVTTRTGTLIKTLSKLVADGFNAVEARLSPIIYTTSTERNSALTTVTNPTLVGYIAVGRTCYDKQDRNLYICVEETVDTVTTRIWSQLSDLTQINDALLADVLRGRLYPSDAKISITSFNILKDIDKLFDNDAVNKHHIAWPMVDTTLDGLVKLINRTQLPATGYGVRGVDFGCRFPIDQLLNASTPEAAALGYDWTTSPNRLFFRNNAPQIAEKMYIPGYCDIANSYNQATYIRDCYIDPNYGAYSGIGKYNQPDYPCYIEHCTIRRFINEATALNYGHMAYCDIELSRGDGLKAAGHDIHYHGNMIRLLGYGLVSAHADALQVWDCTRMTITQNTFWMPGTSTVYDEEVYGSTQIIRLITESGANVLSDVYVMGNILAGGGFTIAVRSRYSGSLVQNIVIANNLIADKIAGDKIWLYGPIAKDHWPNQQVGTTRNLMIWNNVMSDGSKNLRTELPGAPGTGPNQQGMWYFDKRYASVEFLELGKRYGLLDWNGDLAAGVLNYGVGGVMPT